VEQVSGAEIRAGRAADDEERVARHDIAEADDIRGRVGLAGQHDPQRPAPHDLHRTRLQCRGCLAGLGRLAEVDRHAVLREQAECLGGVEGRVEQGTEILRQRDHARGPPGLRAGR
jgi:hypothetical protein